MLQVIQDYINIKDWDGLADEQSVNFFWFISSFRSRELKVDKDFFFDMVFNEDRMRISKNIAESKELATTGSSTGRRLNKIIEQNNIKFTVQEWTKFLMSAKKMVESKIFQDGFLKSLLLFKDKDVNYFRSLITNLELFRYIYTGFKRYEFILYLPQANKINELPQGDRDFFIENANVYHSLMDFYPRENEDHTLLEMFKTPKEAIKYLFEDRVKSSSIFRSFSFGGVLSNLNVNEYEETFNYIFEEQSSKMEKYKINELLVYFNRNRQDDNKKMSDELLEKMVDFIKKNGEEYYGELKPYHFNDIFSNGIHGMTKEQMAKHIDIISSRWLIKSEQIDLNEAKALKEEAGLELIVENVSDRRFFTEEEIRSNPEFFNPKHLKQNPLYCTKETFKILNSQHKLRQRYDEKMVDFGDLVEKMIIRGDLNIKVLTYLMKKTNSGAMDVVDAIEKSYWPERIKDKNILILQKFYKRFKL